MNHAENGTGGIAEVYPDVFDDELQPGETGEKRKERMAKHQRLYVATRYVLVRDFGASTEIPREANGLFGLSLDERIRFLSVYGELLLRNFEDPSLGRQDRGTAGPDDVKLEKSKGVPSDDGHAPPVDVIIVAEFMSAVTDAVKRFNTNRELFRQSYFALRKEGHGKVNNGQEKKARIRAKLLAAVADRLIIDGADPKDPFIVRLVKNALSSAVGASGFGAGGVGANPSARSLKIPNLDAAAAVEILPDNLEAVRFIYFSAQLEEMKLHAVHDKIVEHFMTGMLPVSRGSAADKLHGWMKRSADRITELERRALYGRVLGVAQGATEVLPNREFTGLWVRFLSTVSQKYREVSSTERDQVSVEQIHKSGRDLAVNLSLHGYGWASPAATEMMDVVNDVFAMLDEQIILQSYGVRDRWQLVDRISNLYLGGAANGVKYRALAQSGQQIINWLAESSAVLASGSASGLSIVEWQPNGRRKATDAFEELAELCERWLAASGTADATAAQNTDPVDLPTQHTVPMLGQSATGVPQAVQDALDQMGGGNLPNLPVIPQA